MYVLIRMHLPSLLRETAGTCRWVVTIVATGTSSTPAAPGACSDIGPTSLASTQNTDMSHANLNARRFAGVVDDETCSLEE